MPLRRLSLWALALTLLLPLPSRATSVIPPDFNTLVNSADYVVRGVVKSVNSEWREKDGHKYIATKVEVEVRETIRGTPPAQVVLDMVGGRVGEDELVVTGAPQFQVGDEDILFVQGNGRQVYPLVAIMHGRYPIFHDTKTGQDLVVRSNGMPLYSEQDVALPMTTLSATKQANSAAKPMTAAAFVQKIRNAGPVTVARPAIQN